MASAACAKAKLISGDSAASAQAELLRKHEITPLELAGDEIALIVLVRSS